MALTRSIHGYSDLRLAKMPRTILESINLEADKDYVTRTLPGSVIIFLLLIFAGLMSQISLDNPLFYYAVTSLSFMSMILHFFLFLSVRD